MVLEVSGVLMNRDEITSKLKNKVLEIISNPNKELDEDTNLLGSDRVLDSLGLVELCIYLEDVSSEYNFQFDWTSEFAMSKSQSVYKNLKSIVDEFLRQSEKK